MGEPDFVARIRNALARRHRFEAKDESLRPASVLVPLFAKEPNDTPLLWLVRRTEDMRVHRGQVALPGGKRDPADVDLLATALREAHEEIGLPEGEVQVLGALDDCATHTGFAVTPFVGFVPRPFTPAPHAAEVARVFACPLSAFEREPQAFTIREGTSRRIVPRYEAAGETIWGITAGILRRFMLLLSEADRPQAP